MFTELFFLHNFNTNKVNFDVEFNAYPLLPFWNTDHSKWLYGPEKLSGLSRIGALNKDIQRVLTVTITLQPKVIR